MHTFILTSIASLGSHLNPVCTFKLNSHNLVPLDFAHYYRCRRNWLDREIERQRAEVIMSAAWACDSVWTASTLLMPFCPQFREDPRHKKHSDRTLEGEHQLITFA